MIFIFPFLSNIKQFFSRFQTYTGIKTNYHIWQLRLIDLTDFNDTFWCHNLPHSYAELENRKKLRLRLGSSHVYTSLISINKRVKFFQNSRLLCPSTWIRNYQYYFFFIYTNYNRQWSNFIDFKKSNLCFLLRSNLDFHFVANFLHLKTLEYPKREKWT